MTKLSSHASHRYSSSSRSHVPEPPTASPSSYLLPTSTSSAFRFRSLSTAPTDCEHPQTYGRRSEGSQNDVLDAYAQDLRARSSHSRPISRPASRPTTHANDAVSQRTAPMNDTYTSAALPPPRTAPNLSQTPAVERPRSRPPTPMEATATHLRACLRRIEDAVRPVLQAAETVTASAQADQEMRARLQVIASEILALCQEIFDSFRQRSGR
ncbi:hypothetical protein BCV70DRAFT_7934 [Testicularia cyperi]|uniref:Uncharacterized protein n=1 Tax=Testicularia cyperi TaxID=1882483 RepID=A0A317XYA5_9BASI|nr:hypothetical protein BCV70DRAFT_7934 [Testicularia cyperi]